MSSFSIAKLRLFVRARARTLIKLVGDRARSSARLRCLSLRLLRVHPSLELNLRRLYLGCRFDDQLRSFNWPGTQSYLAINYGVEISTNVECLVLLPASCGVNDHQRSPLEAYVHSHQVRP